jgi:hypothetical protein
MRLRRLLFISAGVLLLAAAIEPVFVVLLRVELRSYFLNFPLWVSIFVTSLASVFPACFGGWLMRAGWQMKAGAV